MRHEGTKKKRTDKITEVLFPRYTLFMTKVSYKTDNLRRAFFPQSGRDMRMAITAAQWKTVPSKTKRCQTAW